MGISTDLRRELKSRFEPLMVQKGFVIDRILAPNSIIFRKHTPEAVYLCEIQFEKFGKPRFALNFAKCPVFGIVTHQGKHIPSSEMLPSWAPVWGRLLPVRGSGTASWFRQDRPWIEKLFSGKRFYDTADVVAKLIEFFTEVEEYWQSGNIGRHLRIYSNALVNNAN